MTPDEVLARVAEIAAHANDDEGAHYEEDVLYRDVLSAIAAGAENAPELATEALKAHDVDFFRWYA